MDTKARIKALREALGLSQQQLADRSGGRIDRPMASKLESGVSKGRSAQVREGLAAAVGVSVDDLNAYLDGKLSLAETVGRGKGAPAAPPRPETRVERDPAPAVESDGTPLERALGQAFDPGAGHLVRDLRAVEDAFSGQRHWERVEGDLVGAARRWLDAAMQLRKEGQGVDAQGLLVRVTVGKGALASEAHARHAGELRAHVAAHVAAHDAEEEQPDPAEVERLKETARRAAKKRGGRG